MSNTMQTFRVEIPFNDSKAMEEFQKLMDRAADAVNDYEQKEMDRLGITNDLDMMDIIYLRSRSRWTQEKEDYLIRLSKEGKKFPFMMEDFEVK